MSSDKTDSASSIHPLTDSPAPKPLSHLGAAELTELRDHLASRLQADLTADDARRTWVAGSAELLAELLRIRIDRLVEIETLEAALASALDPPTVERSVKPALRRVLEEVTTNVSERSEPLSTLLSEDGRRSLEQLLSQRELVPPELIRALFEDPAVEAVMNDVLFEGIKQFSINTNPFVADWGLPALLGRLPAIGKLSLKASFQNMQAEFDKRLEPEARKFINSFSRRGVDRAMDLTLRKFDEPEFVALRMRLLDALLKRSMNELCRAPSDDRGRLLIDAMVDTYAHVLSHELLGQELRRWIRHTLSAHGDRTLGELLAEWGIELPKPRAMAEALWPAVSAAIGGSFVGERLKASLEVALEELR